MSMEVQMEVIRVGEEAEAAMMIDATHVVLETAPWTTVAEMATIIEAVGGSAHALGLLTDTIDQGGIAASVTNEKAANLETHVALEMRTVAEAEAPRLKSQAVKAPHH